MSANGKMFLFEAGEIKKVTSKIEDSNLEELEEAVTNQKERETIQINSKVFEILKKAYGDFEIVF